MKRMAICIGVYGYRGNTKLRTGTNNPYRYLSTVCYKYFFEQRKALSFQRKIAKLGLI
jgi:hypothetical protein